VAGAAVALVIVVDASNLGEAVRRIEPRGGEAAGLRRVLLEAGVVRRLDSVEWRPPSRLGAVDSAFPKSPLYLIGVSVSLVAVASVYSGEGGVQRRIRSWLLAEEQGELDQDYVSAFARLRERAEALRLLGEEGVEVLLLDGELVPRPGRVPLWGEVKSLSDRLLGYAASSGRCLAGVLKRSYSSSIASRLGLRLSDRALASMALRRGEAIIMPHGFEELARRGCVEALYKPMRGMPAAVRVEACCSRPLELLAWLASSAGPSGLPWPIDLVDSLAKQAASRITVVESLLLSRLARRELQHLGYTANPQETMRRNRQRAG
jgi:hypothetical protein